MPAPKGHPRWGGIKKGSKLKKTVEQEEALEAIRCEIRKHLPELIKGKIELARGIFVEKVIDEYQTVEGKNGKTKVKKVQKVVVFKERPDGSAINDLFDRLVGKPKQLMEFEGDFPSSVVINITSEEVDKAKQRLEAKKKKK